MRLARRVGAGPNNAKRLSFEHRTKLVAEVKHDMPDVALCVFVGESEITGDSRCHRFFQSIQIQIRMRSRPRRVRRRGRHGCIVLWCFGFICCVCFGRQRTVCRQCQRHRQLIPTELRFYRIRIGFRHHVPMVNRTSRAWRHAGIAAVADVRVHHIVAVIMRDRTNRTRVFTRIATYADLGINQVLLDQHDGFSGAHDSLS